jgi:hypothetical protein
MTRRFDVRRHAGTQVYKTGRPELRPTGSLLGAATAAWADDATRLAPFDELMTSFVREQQVPGASLA